MTNREYSNLVDRGEYPSSPWVPIEEPFTNASGEIINLLTGKFTHAAVLTSNAGAIRANHYHKTDWHYTYIVSGAVDYYWRSVGDQNYPKRQLYKQGEMFFSPPMVEHAMFFPGPATIITFARNERSDHATHESDLVRVPVIKRVWNAGIASWIAVPLKDGEK